MIGAFVFVLMTSIGVVIRDPEALPILSIIGTWVALFMAVLALPGLIAGYGLLKRRMWGRVLAFASACQSVNRKYMDNFEVVWQMVNDKYFGPTFGGLESHTATIALKGPGGHAVVRVEDEVDVTNGVGI